MTDIVVSELEQSPQARWAVVETPQAAPAECLLCRGEASNRKWFIETGISWDFYGAIYICSECVLEITHILGFITPIEASDLRTERDISDQELHHLKVQLAAMHSLEKSIDDFIESRANRSHLRPGSNIPISMEPTAGSSDESIDGGAEKSDGGTEGGPPSTEDSMGIGERETPESSDDQRLAELHTDAEPNGGEFVLNI